MIDTKGSGKSSTGNCILGENKFKVFVGTKLGTNRIQRERKDTNIIVVDTPGVNGIAVLKEHMTKLHEMENAVFAIVIAIGRYTPDDQNLLTDLEQKFEKQLKKSFIIFTRKNELDVYENADNRTIHYWLKTVHKLTNFIDRHKIPICVIENGEIDLTLKETHRKELISICKKIYQATACNARETNKKTITVGYEEMKKAFCKQGANFF